MTPDAGNVAAPPPSGLQVLRLPDVMARVGLRRTQIYALMSKQAFPASVKLPGRAVGWFSSEIDAWLAALPRTRGSR